jgi:heme/copper-type cytochrome/quinol oxidase subunit 3
MNMFLAGLTIIMAIVLLVPVTGVVVNVNKVSDEKKKDLARFYAVGMTVGIMFASVGALLIIIASLVVAFQ